MPVSVLSDCAPLMLLFGPCRAMLAECQGSAELSSNLLYWQLQDLGYLRQEVYDREWNQTLAAAKPMTTYAAVDKARGAVKILYNSQKEYEDITGDFKMLREWKVRTRFPLYLTNTAQPLLRSPYLHGLVEPCETSSSEPVRIWTLLALRRSTALGELSLWSVWRARQR